MSNELTDQQLAELLAKERPSQGVVVEAYRRFVPRMIVQAARRLGVFAIHAEDVAQETFSKILLRGAFAKMQDPSRIRTYLMVATDRAAVDLLRSIGPETTVTDGELSEQADADDWMDKTVDAWRPEIEQVLNSLNGPDADIIRSRFYDGASLDKIAKKLNISYFAAGQRLSRAMRRARRAAAAGEQKVGVPVKVVA